MKERHIAHLVIPAQAGIQGFQSLAPCSLPGQAWTPAFAGVTNGRADGIHSHILRVGTVKSGWVSVDAPPRRTPASAGGAADPGSRLRHEYIPGATAFAKLKALAEGTAIVRRELGGVCLPERHFESADGLRYGPARSRCVGERI